VDLPTEIKKAIGMKGNAPMPKALRYLLHTERAEKGIATAAPSMVQILVGLALKDPDPKIKMQAAVYLLDRHLGRPASQTTPQAEDRAPPERLRSAGGVEQMLDQLLDGASMETIEGVKNLVLEDLKKRGRISDAKISDQGEPIAVLKDGSEIIEPAEKESPYFGRVDTEGYGAGCEGWDEDEGWENES